MFYICSFLLNILTVQSFVINKMCNILHHGLYRSSENSIFRNNFTKKNSIIILAYYCVILSSHVPEVVRSHKPLVTDRAYEVFLSCMRPCVSG